MDRFVQEYVQRLVLVDVMPLYVLVIVKDITQELAVLVILEYVHVMATMQELVELVPL